jgi:hypothetical protein
MVRIARIPTIAGGLARSSTDAVRRGRRGSLAEVKAHIHAAQQ